MGQQVLKSSNEKMEKAVAAYSRELATVRAGRANASVLDKVQVDYYGAPTPVVQLANITVPSLEGFKPKSAFKIAFSISPIEVLS
ncbi:ribosome-recycling factor [Streptococcus pneumoniae]|nr:ribosome-recycling factor [Streptococcus pneumoniae]